MKKGIIVSGIIMLSALFLMIAIKPPQVSVERPLSTSREGINLKFVEDELLHKGGVHTTFHAAHFQDEFATGREVLSESQGALMLYYAKIGDRKSFDAIYSYLKDHLKGEKIYFYREGYTVNAAIDDFRIIEALSTATHRFKIKRYLRDARQYSENLYDVNIKKGYLVDFYDEKYQVNNAFITLGYVDLSVMRQLGKDNPKWQKLQEKMLKIVEGGYISDAFPFYFIRYQYDTGLYDRQDLHISEALMTLFQLAKIGRIKETSLAWLRQNVSERTLYGAYRVDGTPLNHVQSTAAYGIVAQIAMEVDDEWLYQESIKAMEQFQILDSQSPLYGAFGDEHTGEAYSFDQLMALLAYER